MGTFVTNYVATNYVAISWYYHYRDIQIMMDRDDDSCTIAQLYFEGTIYLDYMSS